ncbi:MAG: hypothetical protein AAB834_04345 [Patescibacteria group bacterium]
MSNLYGSARREHFMDTPAWIVAAGRREFDGAMPSSFGGVYLRGVPGEVTDLVSYNTALAERDAITPVVGAEGALALRGAEVTFVPAESSAEVW